MEAVLAWCERCHPNLPIVAIISAENAASISLAKKLRFAFAGEAMLGETQIGLYRRASLTQ